MEIQKPMSAADLQKKRRSSLKHPDEAAKFCEIKSKNLQFLDTIKESQEKEEVSNSFNISFTQPRKSLKRQLRSRYHKTNSLSNAGNL